MTVGELIKILELYPQKNQICMITKNNPIKSVHIKGDNVFLSTCEPIATEFSSFVISKKAKEDYIK
jgi:hypothetical protein